MQVPLHVFPAPKSGLYVVIGPLRVSSVLMPATQASLTSAEHMDMIDVRHLHVLKAQRAPPRTSQELSLRVSFQKVKCINTLAASILRSSVVANRVQEQSLVK